MFLFPEITPLADISLSLLVQHMTTAASKHQPQAFHLSPLVGRNGLRDSFEWTAACHAEQGRRKQDLGLQDFHCIDLRDLWETEDENLQSVWVLLNGAGLGFKVPSSNKT